MKLCTKKGDSGRTVLLGGKKVKKTSALICALGEIDELSCFLGLASCKCGGEGGIDVGFLQKIQTDLYKIGGELGGATKVDKILNEDVTWLEEKIDEFCREKDLNSFAIPGKKGELSARLHVCRAVCRRAERACFKLGGPKKFRFTKQYLNRLSDLLFAMAEC